MTFEEFESQAHNLFATIPPEFRGGVEGVLVSGRTMTHPELPDVYTMGECVTGELDYDDGVPQPTRSEVRLYYGSFRALAEQDEDFDWQGELWETLTHEIRHHRESAAGEDALEDYDDAADENFKRRDGLAFDPFFYRGGEPVGESAWEVDDDLFVEMIVDEGRLNPEQDIEVVIDGERIGVPAPEDLGDVCFLYLEGFGDGRGDVTVVLVRRIGFWEQLRTLFRREEPVVAEWTLAEGDWVRLAPAEGSPD